MMMAEEEGNLPNFDNKNFSSSTAEITACSMRKTRDFGPAF